MDNPKEIFIEAGLRFNENHELESFGIDEINAAISFGYHLATMQKGRALMTKVSEDTDNVRVSFNGFTLVAVLKFSETDGGQSETMMGQG